MEALPHTGMGVCGHRVGAPMSDPSTQPHLHLPSCPPFTEGISGREGGCGGDRHSRSLHTDWTYSAHSHPTKAPPYCPSLAQETQRGLVPCLWPHSSLKDPAGDVPSVQPAVMSLLPHMLSRAMQSLPYVHTNHRAGHTGSRTTGTQPAIQKANWTALWFSALNQEVPLHLPGVTLATAVALTPSLSASPHSWPGASAALGRTDSWPREALPHLVPTRTGDRA